VGVMLIEVTCVGPGATRAMLVQERVSTKSQAWLL
jgi:hypothetical protein